ncbi:hypothetical protein [Inquilinus limosus]|uniref:Uncharacterized protein n=1 Tax=Inquilinus limosus MP06 TaxID=1398085 RepID=A0A0A0DEB0_9PROT|nr:hypothetical protein [Inquilinus limosus]KGM35322.1 hypothetical protein P409_05265 [Inquilinus limosus MP06]
MLAPDIARRLFDLLAEDAYFNDESCGLGAYYVENHLQEIEEAVRSQGYDGPPLRLAGHHYPTHGAVYWIYDPERLTHEEARRLSDQWVSQAQRRP